MPIFKKYGLGLIVFSGLVVAIFAWGFLYWHDQESVRAAAREARDYYQLNLHYRAWNASLGGLYAPADKVVPNPYLEHPQRDVTLTDGRKLTLINPAYMTRMVFERMNAAQGQVVVSKLVSLKPLNPGNAANAWEAAALRSLEHRAVQELTQLTEIDGREFLQFLGPFVTEQPCLRCHQQQGYKVGDLRGAISIAIPMDEYRAAAARLDKQFLTALLVLWGGFSLGWSSLSKVRYDRELALQQSEERNRTIFETSQAGIFMVDPQGVVTVANRRMGELFGYSVAELVGKPYPELVAPDERNMGDTRMHQLMHGEIPAVSLERHYLRRDGKTFWGHLSGRRIVDQHGQLLALVGVVADITPLRMALDEINQAKDYFSSILNAIADPVFVKDEQFRIVEANDAECRLLRRERSEILGKTDADFFPPEQVKVFRACDQLVLETGETLINEEEVTEAGGRNRIVLAHKSCYVDQGGRRFVVGILRDVTEQRALEHQAMRSAQLAAVGELATGVAHEINNPITGVINCAQLLLDRQSVADKDRPVLERIIKGGDRVAAIVRSLLFFARDSGEETQPVELNRLFADVLQLCSDQLFKDGIDLRLNLPDGLVKVNVNPQKIEQVLMNLISNARYALNERGRTNPADKVLEISAALLSMEDGAVCAITVYDNGTGIASDLLERVGTPFVTTKPAGVGTGLGLSISREIVERHGGTLRIESRAGVFTEVTVELPVTE